MLFRKILPVILAVWPYTVVLTLTDETYFLFLLYILLTVVVYILNIWNALTLSCENAEKKLAFYSMMTKLMHIPFYISVFLLGVFLLLVMVVPIFVFAPIYVFCLWVVDIFLVFTTSVYGISATSVMMKKNIVTKKSGILYIVLHLFFVLDVIASICVFIKSKNKQENQLSKQ